MFADTCRKSGGTPGKGAACYFPDSHGPGAAATPPSVDPAVQAAVFGSMAKTFGTAFGQFMISPLPPLPKLQPIHYERESDAEDAQSAQKLKGGVDSAQEIVKQFQQQQQQPPQAPTCPDDPAVVCLVGPYQGVPALLALEEKAPEPVYVPRVNADDFNPLPPIHWTKLETFADLLAASVELDPTPVFDGAKLLNEAKSAAKAGAGDAGKALVAAKGYLATLQESVPPAHFDVKMGQVVEPANPAPRYDKLQDFFKSDVAPGARRDAEKIGQDDGKGSGEGGRNSQ